MSGCNHIDRLTDEYAAQAALYPKVAQRAETRRRPPAATVTATRELRISDAERDALITRLRDHTVAGRLEIAELEERVGLALIARTNAELAALERDLPVPPWRNPAMPSVHRRRTRAPIAALYRPSEQARSGRGLIDDHPPQGALRRVSGAVVLVAAAIGVALMPVPDDNPVGLCEYTVPSAYGEQVEDREDGWHKIDGRSVYCRSGEAVAVR